VTVALAVRGVSKSFGAADVLVDLDLEVPDGSVLALLGPSGCGKTTLLRIVAGLERPDTGVVEIAGEAVTAPGIDVPTERRRVGMVFQNGALFPHLDVARNVGYGLGRDQRRGGPRVDEMLALVGLSEFGDRRPDSLSGGQAQRVAIARALAPSPQVLLLDEPFSNLDAVLRVRLRREIAGVLRAAETTTVLVTHDRDEAFALADRVAVMRAGAVVQVGSPREVYRAPVDDWVAEFVGEVGDRIEPVGSVLRPEDLRLRPIDDAGDAPVGTVDRVEFGGADVVITVRLDSDRVVKVRERAAAAEDVAPGDRVAVGRR